MIVYRYQDPRFKFLSETPSFLSASCVSAPVMGNNIPNIEIIVPRGTTGAYIEALGEYPEQKEVLLLDGTRFKMIAETAERKLFEVIK